MGSTNNIGRRLTEHNSGKVDSTKSRIPFNLEAYIAVKNQAKAIELEQYFKTGSGRALLKKRILQPTKLHKKRSRPLSPPAYAKASAGRPAYLTNEALIKA